MIENVFSLVLILLVLLGIALMAKPKTALYGNRLSALAMLFAVLLILQQHQLLTAGWLWLGMALGGALGLVMAVRVKMIQMPQTVAALNAFGGLASAIVALISLKEGMGAFEVLTGGLAIIIGMVTFVGSMVAAGKLAKVLNQRPVLYAWTNASQWIVYLIWLGSLVLLLLGRMDVNLAKLLLFLSASLYGFTFAQRVGGADMPIVISLLNSTSGVAGSISGMVIASPLLVAVGAIVGASGLILTQIMCRAMNRSLGDILLGHGLKKAPTRGGQPEEKAPAQADPEGEQEVSPAPSSTPKPAAKTARQEADLSTLFTDLHKVILIPGYGMALSQAQSQVHALYEALLRHGAEVKFGIHPVAGRMPGHMNVLLAEVGLEYDAFLELEEANAFLKQADLAIIIGANDVVNPAANTAEGTPIYGMPVLCIDQARRRIICNFDTKPGYAGVENPLYQDPDTQLLLGDAKDSIERLLQALAGLDGAGATQKGEGALKTQEASGARPVLTLADLDLSAMKKVLLIPGYGMALSQAQGQVKQLYEALSKRGLTVKFGIHPVAGRMPGHMNVLLAEVGLEYDAFLELEEANDFLKDTDLAIIIGANDVVNPAANTAEGTPIYGMPVLAIDRAKQRIVCNFDTKPGYAGVENPIYQDAETLLLLGDAKDSITQILSHLA